MMKVKSFCNALNESSCEKPFSLYFILRHFSVPEMKQGKKCAKGAWIRCFHPKSNSFFFAPRPTLCGGFGNNVIYVENTYLHSHFPPCRLHTKLHTYLCSHYYLWTRYAVIFFRLPLFLLLNCPHFSSLLREYFIACIQHSLSG